MKKFTFWPYTSYQFFSQIFSLKKKEKNKTERDNNNKKRKQKTKKDKEEAREQEAVRRSKEVTATIACYAIINIQLILSTLGGRQPSRMASLLSACEAKSSFYVPSLMTN